MPQKRSGNWFNCKFCGTRIYRSLAEQRKAPLKQFICSKTCLSPKISSKVRARQRAYQARRRGLIRPPLSCERCGFENPLQAHHHDYNEPLSVEWICRTCHDFEHYEKRVVIIEGRRKHFKPCKCGKAAIAKNKCATCYDKYRSSILKDQCKVPKCHSIAHSRGLCDKHRQNKKFYIYFDPYKKRGPKPLNRKSICMI